MATTIHSKTAAAEGATVDGTGEFRATIARLTMADGAPVVDREGDAYIGPQAFPRGKTVLVSAYQHKSWEGALPVGYATIGANQHTAWATGRLLRETAGGEQTYLTLKSLSAAGVSSEWSFGYDVLDASTDFNEIRQFAPGAKRILKSLDLLEISPVLVGAGIGTATESIKAQDAYEKFMRQVRDLRIAGVLPPEGEDALAKQVRRILDGATATLRRARR
jgi:hypothetical protein